MNRIIQFLPPAFLAAIPAVLAVAPNLQADAWDKKTTVTISEPIEVPGVTLSPGSYVFKLVDSASNRHIVTIQNERQNKTLATILAIPNYRLQPTDKSTFSFWETPAGQPKAVRAWFYPADNFGQEFVYPKGRPTQIAQVTHEETPPLPAPEATPSKGPQEPAIVAQNTPPPAPEREQTPAVAPPQPRAPEPTPFVPQNNAAPRELPQTASNLPLLVLLGFLSVGASLGLGAFAKRMGG